MRKPVDLDEAIIEPRLLLDRIRSLRGNQDLHPRIVSTMVLRYLGEATVPAKGRGSSRVFSIKDLVLVALGMKLDELGFPSYVVRSCVDAARSNWDAAFPGPLSNAGTSSEESKFLVGRVEGDRFQATR